jgi:hypothetical protein
MISVGTNAQTEAGTTIVTQDLESWTKIGLKLKTNKKFNIGLDQGFRFNKNSIILDQMFTEANLKFKLNKNFKLGVGLRYIRDRGGNDLFDNDFRFNLDALFKHKVNDFSFQYRLRFQNRNEIGLSNANGDYYRNFLRLKASLKYNIKGWRLDPVFSVEIFRDLTKVTGRFDNLRFTIGSNYNLKKYGELGAFYRLERELGASYPKTTSIIGLNYVYTFKKRK